MSRLTLDTNILVYAINNEDGRHHAAVRLVERATSSECVLTLQSLGECFRVVTRKYSLPVEDAAARIRGFQKLFSIVAADETALEKAMAAVAAHRLQFWDAMLWATAKLAGCRVIVTENYQGLQELEGVRFLDPFHLDDKDSLDLVLPKV